MPKKEKSIPIGAGTPSTRFLRLIEDVEGALGVRLTIHDRRGVFRTADGTSLVARRGHHTHPYCELNRKLTPGWDRHCWDHCLTYVETRAYRDQAPFLTLCWKGVREVVVPVIRDGGHVATIFAGAFRAPGGRGAPGAKDFPAAVRRIHAALPALTRRAATRIARILHTLGQGFLNVLDQIHLLKETDLDRRSIVRRFVYYHAQEPVRLADLAGSLDLSSSRTSHVVKALFGVSFQELLVRERIQRARALLLSSRYSVGEIARRVGIPNEYYFNRLFTRTVGIPPGRFRRRAGWRR
ncbi:MAG: helix-turn-helix domain-containing protein [Kiritimatiellae bacterium]|nr:helix-turn-helix domain-containing protein [Kiritimatiellia bacterium]